MLLGCRRRIFVFQPEQSPNTVLELYPNKRPVVRYRGRK